MIVCFPLFFISPDRFKTDSGEFRTERIVEIFIRLRMYSKRSDLEQLMECSRKNNYSFNFHQNAKSECLLIVQTTKIKF